MADVTIKLSIGSVSVEVTGSKNYVDKKFEQLLGRFVSSGKAGFNELGSSGAKLEKGGKKTSAAEFVKRSSAKSQFDRALMLGYYLEKSGNSSFTAAELARLGKEIKQPFANASDAVAKLTGRGLMMSAGDKENARAYALTASGETYVEEMQDEKK